MKISVKISKCGTKCEVYYANGILLYAEYSLSEGCLNLTGAFTPHWFNEGNFLLLVSRLYEQWVANALLDKYDPSLHEYTPFTRSAVHGTTHVHVRSQ